MENEENKENTKNTENILVSIVVVTYNFESIILETLESIKEQTYQKIELVITDDNSSDRTVEVCKEWIDQNKTRFINTIVLESKENQGPTKNYNKGLKAATGTWIKYISDDIMKEDFIEDSIRIVNNNPEIEILFSQIQAFTGSGEKMKLEGGYSGEKNLYKYELTAEEQLKEMHKKCFVAAPSNFIKKSLLEEVGYCDERYIYFEDYPLWIKILETGRKLYLNKKVNVLYRRWENSVSARGENHVNKREIEFLKDYFEYEQKYKIKQPIIKFEKWLELYRAEIIIKSGNKGETFYSKMLRYLEPSRYKKKKYRYILIFLIILIVTLLAKN